MNTQEILDLVRKPAALLAAQHERELAEQRQLERERALILRQLTRRFGEVPSHIAQCVAAADAETLDQYADKLVVVASIEEVIAED